MFIPPNGNFVSSCHALKEPIVPPPEMIYKDILRAENENIIIENFTRPVLIFLLSLSGYIFPTGVSVLK